MLFVFDLCRGRKKIYIYYRSMLHDQERKHVACLLNKIISEKGPGWTDSVEDV